MRRPPSWIVLFGAATLLSLVGPLAGLLVDGWWFRSVGYGAVFRTVLLTQVVLGLLGGGLAVVVVGGSARYAARWNRPRPATGTGPRLAPRDPWPWARISPVAAADGVTFLVALVSGATAASSWQRALLFVEGGAFGWRDPVWNLDARFYVFDLVLLGIAFRWLAVLLGIAFLVGAATYVALGTVRVTFVQQDGQLMATGLLVPPEVQRHVGSLVAAFLAVLATLSYLGRYTALVDPSGLFVGPGWADLRATLPLLTVEAVGTAICAFLAFLAIGRSSLAGIAGVVVVVGVLKASTALAPGIVQRISVLPSELSREGPQIRDHVAATRFAFGLDAIEERPLWGRAELTQADIERNRSTIENVRLWDHEPLLEAFEQIQEIRTYYGFVGVDNDRYVIDGRLRQLLLSARELTSEALPAQARTWVNETMIYTHGYGVALGPVNAVGPQGLPELYVRDLPPRLRVPGDDPEPDVLRIDRPEIYFGEATRNPVVVGTANAEFDYPSGDDNAYTRYAGADGVRIGWFGRLVLAVHLGSTGILFSSDVPADGRILLYRHVVERAQRIAPFLKYDADPYLVIDDGRLIWVLDAYTTSDHFPYAAGVPGLGNYLRNAVKVTVDAYDGTVTFWRTAVPDPIADSWAEVFPGLFRPLAEMSPSLAGHLRYPVDLFAAQASLFATYHMQDPNVFYNREDEWEVPVVDTERMTPYFTVMRLPGGEREEFLLMLPLSPRGKPNLAAWMVARSDGDGYGELRAYKFPKDTMVYGPQAIAARIQQDDVISEKLSLWGQQGSEVVLGTLLVVPIEESLIYVRPLYLRADEGSIPELKRVIVAYDDRIAMMPTLEEGLERLFGPAPPELIVRPTASVQMDRPPALTLPAVTTAELVRRAGLHWDAAQAAIQRGDWAEYGVQTKWLGEVLGTLRSGLGGAVAPEGDR